MSYENVNLDPRDFDKPKCDECVDGNHCLGETTECGCSCHVAELGLILEMQDERGRQAIEAEEARKEEMEHE